MCVQYSFSLKQRLEFWSFACFGCSACFYIRVEHRFNPKCLQNDKVDFLSLLNSLTVHTLVLQFIV